MCLLVMFVSFTNQSLLLVGVAVAAAVAVGAAAPTAVGLAAVAAAVAVAIAAITDAGFVGGGAVASHAAATSFFQL